MERKELFVTIKFSLGEAPDISELKDSGLTLQQYAESLVDEMNLGDLANEEIEIKATTKQVGS